MNIETIRLKLGSSEYSFLREHPNLGNNLILLTLGGSHSYGTNNENSDLDVRGISLNTKRELLGNSVFDQYTDEKTDTTIYGSKKVFKLLRDCNPNVIEMLRTLPAHQFVVTPPGELLLKNANLFFSQLAIATFSGYATSQLRRLENALARDQYSPDKKEEHILKSLERQLYHFQNHYAVMHPGYLKLRKEKEIVMDVHLEGYPLRAFAGIYSEMTNVVSDYDKLNHRNNKKTEGGLNKHKMHLVRLLQEGIELNETGDFSTFRPNVKLLLSIRNGEMDNELFFEYVEGLEDKFEYAAKHTVLPVRPDETKIEDLLIAIHEYSLMKGER